MYILHITDIVEQKGITYYELAERLGIKRTTLMSYITSRNPRIDVLDRLAVALDCSISDLVEFHPYKGKGGKRLNTKTKRQMRKDMRFHDRLRLEVEEAKQMMEESGRIEPVVVEDANAIEVEDVYVDKDYHIIENEDDVSIELDNGDEILFNALRALRLKIANETNQLAFMIFHDKTLRLMSSIKPRTVDEFLKIPGVGKAKMEKYGEAFMEMINNYLEYK